MRTTPTPMRGVWFGLALVLAAAWVNACAAEALPPADLRQLAGDRVALVTVRDGLGLPVAYATGFLIGDGRFVLTDLGAAAQPGAVRATVRFEDGSTAEAATFGFADAALGLVALRLEADGRKREGLPLVSDSPALDGSVAVTSAGWEWASALKLVGGRLHEGRSAADLVPADGRAAADPPDLVFLAVNGARVAGAAGSPVLDAEGRVVAVWLELATAGGPADVAVPAPAVRRALLEAKPELKPLADLPEPLWPARVRSVAGESVPPARLAATVRSVKMRLQCDKCGGSGQVRVRRVTGARQRGGISYPVYAEVAETCPDCHGEGAVFRDGTYGYLATMAEQATRVCFDPDLDSKAREATLGGVREALSALADLKADGRRALLAAAQSLGGADSWPRGIVVWAQVLEQADSPQGAYVVLAPSGAGQRLAARPPVESAAGTNAQAAASPWLYGQWILVAGWAEGEVDLGGTRLVWMRPAAWIGAPSLGPRPPRPGGPATDDNAPGPKPQPQPGDPGFFGL